jgi:hypothetical protein
MARKKKTDNPLQVQQTDDGMVVFPMSNGKLATTWVQNVDAILSEGTGKLSVNRLKELKEKLSNTLTLLDMRIIELSMTQQDREAQKWREELIDFLLNKCVGKVICRYATYNQESCDFIYVTKVYYDADTTYIHFEGILAKQNCNGNLSLCYWSEKLNKTKLSVRSKNYNHKLFIFTESEGIGHYTYEIHSKKSVEFQSTVKDIKSAIDFYIKQFYNVFRKPKK